MSQPSSLPLRRGMARLRSGVKARASAARALYGLAALGTDQALRVVDEIASPRQQLPDRARKLVRAPAPPACPDCAVRGGLGRYH